MKALQYVTFIRRSRISSFTLLITLPAHVVCLPTHRCVEDIHQELDKK